MGNNVTTVGGWASQLPGGQQITVTKPGGFPLPNSGTGNPGNSLRPSASDHSHPGPIDVTSPIYGAVGDGVTDCTQAFQRAIADSMTQNSSIYVPSGTYVITQGLVYLIKTNSFQTYYQSLQLIGDGSKNTTILSKVNNGPLLSLDTDASGTFRVSVGCRIEGLTITNGNIVTTASDGIYMRHNYFTRMNDVSFYNLSGSGLRLASTETNSDLDACQWINFESCEWSNCKAWGIVTEYRTAGAHNQTSYVTFDNCWITQCGTQQSPAAFFDNTGAATVLPTSGAVKLKGQVWGGSLVMSENKNVGMFVYADGFGQSNLFDFQVIDGENNPYTIWIQGGNNIIIRELRSHHSANLGVIQRSAAVWNVASAIANYNYIANVDLLADNTLFPNFIAFDGAGTQNAYDLTIERVRWQTEPAGVQTTYSSALLAMGCRMKLTFPVLADATNYGKTYNEGKMSGIQFDTASVTTATKFWNMNMTVYGDFRLQINDDGTMNNINITVNPPVNRTNNDGCTLRLSIYNNKTNGVPVFTWNAIWSDTAGFVAPLTGKMVTRLYHWDAARNKMVPDSGWNSFTP